MMLHWFFSIYALLQGLIIGSFLNVVIDRVPLGAHVRGRSHCDGCGRTLRIMELVPIFSYIWQRGKSTCCRAKLSLQYPLVELATGASFALVTYWYLTGYAIIIPTRVLSLFGLLIVTASSIAITIIDFRHRIIPDSLQLALFVGVLIFHLGMGVLSVDLFGQALIVALPILILYLVTGGGGMGFGDVKMQMTLGLWLGLWQGLLGVYIAFLVGAAYGVMLMLLHKANRKSHIAFGPFLLFGAWMMFVWGAQIMRLAQNIMRMPVQ
ncbi:MAG TPA: prepilin peptidase [Candidatus Woesebacteria bacterium]|nr:prepilin peptidase [Candidatus Woesebacteria bacterium]HNS94640.1 prepilin peptidase [Candidatus Woesebacteria bacterium]